MTLLETTYEHIVVDDAGVPWIEGTTLKIIELVLSRQAAGDTPEALQRQHPTVTLGQIYSALAYYEDHKAALDADIAQRQERVDQIRQATPTARVLDHLRRRKQAEG
ncbi:MAG TPA: DUF433 domain-containing protein [Herpetosiphonaceae bacterium]|nr:DUF433 domain-containing protein [Herpetosiphonaceae bacterium]